MGVKRLSGGTNQVFLIDMNKRQYVLKIPKPAAIELIDRQNEYSAGQITAAAGINIPFIYYDPNSGINITRYQNQSQVLTRQLLQQTSIWQGVADLFKKLHQLPQFFSKDIVIFELFDFYRKKLTSAHREEILIDFYQWDSWISSCQKTLAKIPISKAPCHNDPILENFLITPKNILLIDWEYAGNNDPYWDLASLSVEAQFDQQQDQQFLEYYGQFPLTELIYCRYNIYKILVDYLWALWCCHMQDYSNAKRRWQRFNENATKFIF